MNVRSFGACTADLIALAAWLKQCGVTTIVMESTGVYWIPLFELLESRGFEVLLVNPRQSRHAPGRPKSDVLDCQWLQRLHSYGLLTASFRPAEQIVVLRSYLRQRQMLIRYGAQHVQHMQKALEQMNVKLSAAVSQINGATGMAIIRAIVDGERDPAELAELRDDRCKRSEAENEMAPAFQLHPITISLSAFVRKGREEAGDVNASRRSAPQECQQI